MGILEKLGGVEVHRILRFWGEDFQLLLSKRRYWIWGNDLKGVMIWRNKFENFRKRINGNGHILNIKNINLMIIRKLTNLIFSGLRNQIIWSLVLLQLKKNLNGLNLLIKDLE